LRQNPEHLAAVRQKIETCRRKANPESKHYVLEWERHLDQGVDHLCAIALEEFECASDLGQCSPSRGILSDEERWAYFQVLSASTIGVGRPE
jgi:hypothetical protein